MHARSFCIGLYRCGHLIYSESKPIEEIIADPKIVTASLGNAGEVFCSAYQRLIAEPPQEVPMFNKVTGRVRTLEEWNLAESLIDQLSAGSIVLMDGSLRSSVSLPHRLIHRVCKRAKEKRVHLVGATKTSTLYWGPK